MLPAPENSWFLQQNGAGILQLFVRAECRSSRYAAELYIIQCCTLRPGHLGIQCICAVCEGVCLGSATRIWYHNLFSRTKVCI